MNDVLNKIEKISLPIIITNANGVILFSNHALSRRTGFDANESFEKKPGSLWGGHMPRKMYKQMWDAISVRKTISQNTLTNKTKGKDSYKEYLTIIPLMRHRAHAAELFLGISPESHSKSNMKYVEAISRFVHSHSLENSIDTQEYFSKKIIGSQTFVHARFFVDFLYENILTPYQNRFSDRVIDKNLVLEAQKNPIHFHVLYEKYFSDVESFFLYHLADSSLAYDFSQEVFMLAFKSINAFSYQASSYKTYLLRIAHNILLNHYRKKKTIFTESIPDSFQCSDKKKIETRDLLEHALDKISSKEREALMLRYFNDKSIRQIAHEMNKSENAVKLLLSRGRKKLRTLLD